MLAAREEVRVRRDRLTIIAENEGKQPREYLAQILTECQTLDLAAKKLGVHKGSVWRYIAKYDLTVSWQAHWS